MEVPPMIHSLEELQQFLHTLPPLKNGYVRVYRGQHSNYSKIISTAHRPGHNPDQNYLWESYCKKICARMLVHEKHLLSGVEVKQGSMEVLFQWVKVLSQHYGPGTQYLDVTSSLEIALWFAFNQVNTQEIQFLKGMDEDTSQDKLLLPVFLLHEKTNRDGWLYVFDFPVANNVFTRTHGELIDLSLLNPFIYQSSKRVSMQKGSLVYCDNENGDGDVSGFLLCAPLHLGPGVFETQLAVPTSVIFPGPKEDEWYRKFLKLPYFYNGYTASGMPVAQRAIPCELYANAIDEADILFSSIKECTHVVNPLLTYPVHKYLNKQLTEQDKKELESAIAILMYHSYCTETPSIESGLWHETLLWLNAQLLHPPVKVTKEKKLHINFYVEFSPAELECWDEIDLDGNENKEVLPRSFWLRHYNNGTTIMTLMVQFIPSQKIEVITLQIYFIEKTGKIYYINPLNGEHRHISELGPPAKYLYLILSLMGDINPEFSRIIPSPIFMKDNRYICAYSPKSSRLLKNGVKSINPEKEYYSFFELENTVRSYITPQIGANCRYFIVDSHLPFNEIPALDLYDLSYKTISLEQAMDAVEDNT